VQHCTRIILRIARVCYKGGCLPVRRLEPSPDAFQRHHMSVLWFAESFTRLGCVINTTFREKIYSRWCCIDRLSWHVLPECGIVRFPVSGNLSGLGLSPSDLHRSENAFGETRFSSYFESSNFREGLLRISYQRPVQNPFQISVSGSFVGQCWMRTGI
jgi:hypothetical protein